MIPLHLAALRETVAAGRIEWRKHVLQKPAERALSQQAVRGVLLSGERIRDYTEDKPFPSALFLGYVAGQRCTWWRRATKPARRRLSSRLMCRRWTFLNRTIEPNETHEREP